MTPRCLITYDPLDGPGPYSIEGLRKLSPRLRGLEDFPLDKEEQIREAARLATRISVQGVQPKLSVRLEIGRGRFSVVERHGTFILKPQNPLWPELPENEDLTMRLAEAARIEVPLHGLLRARDHSLSYFVKRFDRTGRRAKLAVEDFAQLAGRDRETKYDSSMEQVAGTLDRHSTFPAIDKERLFSLALFSFLTGNEDMHLKNFSLITTADGVRRLSPSYDLLCTTLALSEAKEELALPLRGKRRNLTRGDLVDYFASERLELNARSVDAVMARFSAAQPRWRELLDASFLSAPAKERYAALLRERSVRLGV